MTLLIGIVLPALVLSLLAACSLYLSSGAPPRVRLWISMIGVFAWVVPWPLLHANPARVQQVIGIPALEAPANLVFRASNDLVSDVVAAEQRSGRFFGGVPTWWPLGLVVPGMIWFAFDIRRHRRTIRDWRKSSRPGESLRDLVPPELNRITRAIFVVPGSTVAAATGWLHPALWIGDRLVDDDTLEAALTHEYCHLLRRDPLLLAFIGFVRRVYFWNPVVAFFTRQSRFFLEAACDYDCARLLGRERYKQELARLILAAAGRPESPGLAAAVVTGGDNTRRVHPLNTEPRIGVRMYAAATLCLVGLAFSATLVAQEKDPRIGRWIENRSQSRSFQGIRRSFEDLGGGVTRVNININASGVAISHSDHKCDGRDYPVLDRDGKATGTVLSCRFTEARAVACTFRSPDRVSIGTDRISEDGERYEPSAVVTDRSGKIIGRVERVFDRRH